MDGPTDNREYTRSYAAYPSRDAYYEDERYGRPLATVPSAAPRSARPPPGASNGHSPSAYDDRDYPRQAGHGGPLPSPLAPPYSTDEIHRDDSYDASIPLARRRGDAAQAKANKLHIDVGSAASERADLESRPSERERVHGGSGGNDRASLGAPLQHRLGIPDSGLVARSAPPTRISFSDRDGSIDFRHNGSNGASRLSGDYGSAAGPAAQQGYYSRPPPPPPPSQGNYREPAPTRGPPQPAPHGGYSPPHSGGRPIDGPPQAASSRPGPAPSGAHVAVASLNGGNGPPPMTSRFVPQTATLPSPAYHSTRMTQNPGQSSVPPGPGGPPPRTGSFPGPPQTARLPDHLRSPPSSKTQFLSLFSSFYDSLLDSRTLKATLEDQVRRSNTLLQTLQKSSTVLEATVERKIREERAYWEQRVKRLESRVRQLEGGEPSESDEPLDSRDAPSRRASEGEGDASVHANTDGKSHRGNDGVDHDNSGDDAAADAKSSRAEQVTTRDGVGRDEEMKAVRNDEEDVEAERAEEAEAEDATASKPEAHGAADERDGSPQSPSDKSHSARRKKK